MKAKRKRSWWNRWLGWLSCSECAEAAEAISEIIPKRKEPDTALEIDEDDDGDDD